MNKYLLIPIIFAIASLFISNLSYAQKGYEEEIYDLVPPKTFQIETDFSIDNAKGETKLSKFIFDANARDYAVPSLTFRLGVARNLELQLITGYRAVILSQKLGKVTRNGRTITIDKNITGLSEFTAGFKYGLFTNHKLRPSMAVTALFTLPNVGVPAFSSENIGSEIDLNFFNALGKYSDVAYDIGGIWDGSDENPRPIWYYRISPEVYASENLAFFIEGYGYLTKNSPTENRLDIGIDYVFSDYVESYIFGGTIINNSKKFGFAGANLTITLPF